MDDNVTQISDFSPSKTARLEIKLRGKIDLLAVEKLMIYQALSRHWRRYLTPTEFVVLLYIVDRTAGWGKGFFIASAKNVLEGTPGYSGVGVGRTAYYDALKSLQGMGAISRKSFRDRTAISLHVNWCEPLE